MNRRHTLLKTSLAALSLASGASAALAQTSPASPWPTQPVKIIVPYAAGGTTDMAARLIGAELSKKWGQPVTVDNKPGAATQVGTDLVAKSKDNHTLLVTAGPFAVNPSLFAKLPYDTYKDFKPVSLLVRNGLVLVTAANQPLANIADVINAGKNEKALNFASSGNGTLSHMVAELIADENKLNLQHTPYRGSAPALADVASGQVQFMFDNPSSALPLIKEGKLKALAYTGLKRSKALPSVPTIDETTTNFQAINWFGLIAPSPMDDQLLNKISRDVNEILKNKDIVERFQKDGVDIGGIHREAFGAFLAAETIRWAKIIRARNIKPD